MSQGKPLPTRGNRGFVVRNCNGYNDSLTQLGDHSELSQPLQLVRRIVACGDRLMTGVGRLDAARSVEHHQVRVRRGVRQWRATHDPPGPPVFAAEMRALGTDSSVGITTRTASPRRNWSFLTSSDGGVVARCIISPARIVATSEGTTPGVARVSVRWPIPSLQRTGAIRQRRGLNRRSATTSLLALPPATQRLVTGASVTSGERKQRLVGLTMSQRARPTRYRTSTRFVIS